MLRRYDDGGIYRPGSLALLAKPNFPYIYCRIGIFNFFAFMALYDSYSDKQLVALLKDGDAEVFSAIYERYWDRLLVYVMRAVRRQPDAEDIVQELFVSLWRRREELNIEFALSTYLYNSARYLALRYIEQNITRSNHLQSLAAWLSGVPAEQDAAIEAAIFGRELEEKLHTLVAQLPPKMQEIFLLSRRDHLSYKEIAERLSISEETVRKQISNSLRILRGHLGQLPIVLFMCLLSYYL